MTKSRIRSSTLRDLSQDYGQSVGHPAPDQNVQKPPPLLPQLAAQDVRLGSITSGHLSMNANGGTNLGGTSFTSTDTTQWLGVSAMFASVPTVHSYLFLPTSFHMKHSVANALVGAELIGYSAADGTATGTSAAFWIADNLIMPATANNWVVFNPTGIGGTLDLAAFGPWTPGTHYILLAVRNYTAGTLTVIQPNDDFMAYFVLGA